MTVASQVVSRLPSVRSLAARSGRAAALLAATGLLGLAVRVVQLWATRPGFRRLVHCWRLTGPIALRYFLARKTTKGEDWEAQREKLHVWSAPLIRRMAEELGGVYVKVLQMSRMAPGMLPDAWKRELSVLNNSVRPTSWEVIKEVIEQDLGAPVSGLFESIEREPLGSASLGQAHLAMWRGRRVVVKVQYPNSAPHLSADFASFETLMTFMGFIRSPEDRILIQRCRRQFETELDYQQEARHLRGIRDSLAAVPEFSNRVAVPEPIPELTRGRVLGMEYLPGGSLETELLRRMEMLGVKSLRDTDMMQRIAQEGLGDSLPRGAEAAAVRRPRSQRLAMAIGSVLGLERQLWLARLVAEARLRCMRCRGRAGKGTKELRAVLRLLLDVQAYQIFFSPFFNGDPHSGNVLLLPDGRLGFIDLGQCMQLPKDIKAAFAHLMIVLCEPPSPEVDARILRLAAKLNMRTANNHPDFLPFIARFAYCRYESSWVANDKKYINDMNEADRITYQPVEIFMLSRGATLIRGICFMLQENISLAEAYRPWAERWLQENPGWDILD